jgi:uncharacterized protein
MTQAEIIDKTAAFMRHKSTGEGTGHDWWHMYRVWQLSKAIGSQEKDVDMFVVEVGALLHDIADWKFHDGDDEAGPKAAREWLESIGTDESVIRQVAYIIPRVSYKGGTNKLVMESLEGKIVQDADRLDAIGAIGIGRVFAFGGSFGRVMHDPSSKAQNYESFEGFKKQLKNGSTVNHFYEKLLLVKDGLHTETARKLAAHRHQYMEDFLKEFYAEWEGKL